MATSDAVRAGSEAERLEALWAGSFGDEYVERNLGAYERRGPFWRSILEETGAASVCEVGCNVGGNLRWITPPVRPERVVGIDVNRKALALLSERLPGVRVVETAARSIPLADRAVELVFTMGVLIHQPDESLGRVMDEMVRVASRWVLCGEYADQDTVEVPYRGHAGALFRRDYGGLFLERFPDELALVRQGFLTATDGFDDVTYWLFARY
jgi:pseudaminic acid biosynthesis-associated methylase